MQASELVRRAREESGLSVRALADASGVAASTVHRIEQGDLRPTLETLRRIVEAAGMRLRVEAVPDHSSSIMGLGRAIRDDIADGDSGWPLRRAAELVKRFEASDETTRRRMISAEPEATGDQRWDAFLAGLAEWLAVRAELPPPAWTHQPDRFLRHGWWVSRMKSMQAWEYAGSPAAFQIRGVYVHRESLTNV